MNGTKGERLIEHQWLSSAIETQFLFNSTFDFIKNHQLAKAWIPNSTKRLKQCLHIFVYFFNSIITEDLTCFFIQWRVISRDIFYKEIQIRENRVGTWDFRDFGKGIFGLGNFRYTMGAIVKIKFWTFRWKTGLADWFLWKSVIFELKHLPEAVFSTKTFKVLWFIRKMFIWGENSWKHFNQ